MVKKFLTALMAFLALTIGGVVIAEPALARGPVTLYCQAPAPIMRQTYPNWYQMAPCTSYYADAIHPYSGWGMTYYNNGVRYKNECRDWLPSGCPSVLVPTNGIAVVGVYHL